MPVGRSSLNPDPPVRLQFLGGGKMAEALIGGLSTAGWAGVEELAVVEKLSERRAELAARFAGLVLPDEPLDGVDVLLAVKPQDVEVAAGRLAGRRVRRVLSIAAGVTIATLERLLEPGTVVVRAMPNTPALVGEGAGALAGGSQATSADLDWGRDVLSSVGLAVVVDEVHLDAVTGLSGSGPAYVFLVAEALIEAGIRAGLPVEVATELTHQTLVGAALLLRQSDDGAAQLRANVTSPGGTTAEGLRVLGEREVPDAFVQAVLAAAARSAELGGA